MKKTIFSFGVLLAIACCTLAYAITGTGHSVLSRSDGSANAMLTDSKPGHGASSAKSKKNLQIDEASLMRALSKVNDHAAKRKAPAARSANEHVVDYWGDGSEIVPFDNVDSFDAQSNTITLTGTVENYNHIFAKMDTRGDYQWMSANGSTYYFSGVLSSDGNAQVWAYILYQNTDGQLYISNSYAVNLNEENGYTSEFTVSTTMANNIPLLVAFTVGNSSPEVTITSTENSFTGVYEAVEAQLWNGVNNLPGLGLDNPEFDNLEKYTAVCDDGVSTIGIIKGDAGFSITGINTPRSELVLPYNIIVNGEPKHMSALGPYHYGDAFDWSGAQNLKTLDASQYVLVSLNVNGSTLTDLYVGNGQMMSFYGDCGEIYLHIPYGSDKSYFKYDGFKRVLVGDENPSYPETTKSDYVIAGENEGEYFGISDTGNYFAVSEIFSQNESVTLPNVTPHTSGMYFIRYAGRDNNIGNGQLCKNAPNLKSLTIPDTYTNIYINWSYNQISELHMQGNVPSTYWTIPGSMDVYVGLKDAYLGYNSNSAWNQATISPEGWEFEWVTVNVQKPGEFAETYLTENNFDWGAAQYVKVTGNINNVDLSAIKNLTNLMKLDLSETTISELPESFMYQRTSLMDVSLPSTIQKIGANAFYGCTSLESFDLNGIKNIGDGVFNGCKKLSYINLTGVQSIGDESFRDCVSLNGIDLSSLTSISSSAFQGCTALEEVDLSSLVNMSYGSYFSNGTFYGCSSLRTVKLGENLRNLSRYCFANTGLETIEIPESIEAIPNGCFSACAKLTEVVLPSSVKEIGENAFDGCTSLTNISLITGLEKISNSAFKNCSSLQEITIPGTVTSIGSAAFYNTGIKTFKCYAVVPPVANSAFIGGNMDLTRTYLYVPPFSKDFYRNTQYWGNFYLMRSIEDQIDYILVDRPLTINLEEEDNDVVANNPEIRLSIYNNENSSNKDSQYLVGQLTAVGEGTLSAGQMSVDAMLCSRYGMSDWGGYNSPYIPTLLNYADKMSADNVSHTLIFQNNEYGVTWFFITLPYDVKVSDIVPSKETYWVIRRYDSAARAAGDTSYTWVNLTEDDTLEAGKGYIVSVSGGETYKDENGSNRRKKPSLTFSSGNSLTKNNLFPSTDIIVGLQEYAAEFAHNRSWNLVGNPYPCYFDMHYLNEEFTSPVTIWDGDTYVAYSPVDDDLVLAPYESFFVQCPLNATEMTFKEEGRMHHDEGKTMFKAAANGKTAISVEDRNVFNFLISSGEKEDRTRIVLNRDAKLEYEIGKDASKFFAEGNAAAQIYVSGDAAYSICERPVGDGTATLGVRASKDEELSISLNGKYSDEWDVMLTDNVTGQTVDLTKGEYRFMAASGDDASRFTVKFMIGGKDVTGVESILTSLDGDTVVTVSDVNGIVLYTGKLSELSVPAAGLYIVSDGTSTFKTILK